LTSAAHRILVVDDEEMIRDSIVEFLDDNGYQAVGAADGQEALNTLTAGGVLPCLILLDLMMPVMDGWELRAALNAHPAYAAIPVVVVSAMTEDTAAKLGAAAYLPKPVDIDRMVDIVCEHCRDAQGGGGGKVAG
jgi:CheY-like chemotaxis protein